MYPNIELLQFITQRIGNPLQRIFAGVVKGKKRQSYFSQKGADIDNHPAVLTSHERNDIPAHPQHTENVHFKLRKHLLFRHLFDSRDQSVTGVVDQHVDPVDTFQYTGDRCGIGNIQFKGIEVWRSDIRKFFRCTAAGINSITVLGKIPCTLSAHTAAAPCDKCYFLIAFHDSYYNQKV